MPKPPEPLYVKNIDRLRVKRDGTHLFVTLDDFVNLQESPSLFFGPDDWQYDKMAQYVDRGFDRVDHLPYNEQKRISFVLTHGEPAPTLLQFLAEYHYPMGGFY